MKEKKQLKKEKNNKHNKTILLGIVLIVILLVIIVIISAKEVIQKRENKEIEEGKSNLSKRIEVEKVTESNEVMEIKEDASGDSVPVPKGYIGSSVEGENEIDTGYVIYEGEEEVTESNLETAKTTRNQYVWVPVPDASEVYGIDSNGKLWGKLYNFGTSTSPNDPPIAYNWKETDGVMSITSTSSYKEPSLLSTSYDIDSNLKQAGVSSRHEFQINLEREFYQAIESIEKYGGFYIGRYETGGLSGDGAAIVRKGQSGTNIANRTWYAMYKKCKTLANTNVRTSMIWGSQWDATLQWMLRSEDEEVVKFVRDSTDKGNYTGKIKATGSSEDYKVNNIYDMAGNVFDWTLEANSSSSRVLRGGTCSYSGAGDPASDRSSNIPTFGYNDYYGCRAALFM